MNGERIDGLGMDRHRSTRRHRSAAGPGFSAAGFTLLELIVVAGVLAVLLGIGVGFVGRSSGLAEATASIGAQLRAAALQARSRALPTEVVVEPGVDGANAVVRARGLEPMALFSFEPGQRLPTLGSAPPTLAGQEVLPGRFGCAREALPGQRGPVLRVPLSPAAIDLRDGFAIRVDLRLQRRDAGTLLTIARNLEVRLDQEARVHVRMVRRGVAGGTDGANNLQSAVGLPVGRWCTFEVGSDGSALWCAIDGRTVARELADASLRQEGSDLLDLLPAEQPLAAVVDEVQLFAYAFLPPLELPMDVEPQARYRVAFDPSGEPIVPPKLELKVHREDRTVALTVGPGGVLQ